MVQVDWVACHSCEATKEQQQLQEAREEKERRKASRKHKRSGSDKCLFNLGAIVGVFGKETRKLEGPSAASAAGADVASGSLEAERSLQQYMKGNRVMQCPTCQHGLEKTEGNCNHVM